MTPPLIQSLLQPRFYPHPVADCQLIETHISWVILAGEFAYKIKKPLNLGFLDFSSLEKRRHYCAEEIRLNRRLAPEIYLDVLSIGGSAAHPLYQHTPAIEYAVRMRRFEMQNQLDILLGAGHLDSQIVDAFAQAIARFHQSIVGARPPANLGTPSQVWQPMAENFQQIRALPIWTQEDPHLSALEAWSQEQYRQHQALLSQRLAEGFVRECHGDMHLANLAWIDHMPLIFDGIEFNPALRWIDVISEIAFVVMDLHQHHRSDLAWRLLNGYLEHSGDYAGLALLRFYLVYRAMVRAKIAAIRLAQLEAGTAQQAARSELQDYLQLAASFTRAQRPQLLICHGLSGSGKSVLGMQLLARIGGLRIRSDVERKRLFGVSPQQRGEDSLYQPDATAQTYQRLARLAGAMLGAGFTVMVDASFLDAAEREHFAQLAKERGCPFWILSFSASETVLRQRLAARRGDASDADTSVLDKQLASFRALAEAELKQTLSIDSEAVDPLRPALTGLLPTSAQSAAGRDD
ncbi:MAG: AAA family ATPase [Thiohalomonadaceae bacterium]